MVETVQPRRFGAGQQSVKPANSSRRLLAAFDFATSSHFRAIVFLVLCCIVLFVPGFVTIPAIDRDEARFAQATKQMVESGDFVDIRFQDDVRYKKPVGVYWLQSAAVETASKLGVPRAQLRTWLYRVPSLIVSMGAVGGLMWPVVLLLRWFVAILWRAGEAFFADSLGGDMLSKLAAQESHGAAPGLCLLLFWVTFWPGAPLAGMAAPAVWRARREPGAQYLLAWLVPSWIVFELVLTKLPHYVLPLYPAIAMLTAGALERRVLSRSWLMRGAAWWFVIPAIASVIAVVGAITVTRQPIFLAWPFVAARPCFGLLAWWLYEDNRAERSLLNAVVAAIFLSAAI